MSTDANISMLFKIVWLLKIKIEYFFEVEIIIKLTIVDDVTAITSMCYIAHFIKPFRDPVHS